jgi:hypothetical protein
MIKKKIMNEVDGDRQTYSIIGAAMEVHKELGCGFLEVVYLKALAREFAANEIPFKKEATFPISYKGQNVFYKTFKNNRCNLWTFIYGNTQTVTR